MYEYRLKISFYIDAMEEMFSCVVNYPNYNLRKFLDITYHSDKLIASSACIINVWYLREYFKKFRLGRFYIIIIRLDT